MSGFDRKTLQSALIFSCALMFASAGVCAQTVKVHFDPTQSQVHWSLPSTLHTVHGTFALQSGEIAFDEKTGAASGLFVVVEDTGKSGDGIRDARMKKSILKTSEFPTAEFHPTHVSGIVHTSGASTLTVDGVMQLYGAAHPLQLNLQVNATGSTVDATTKFSIPFIAWGMHDPSTLFLRVDKSVQMEIDAKGSLLR